VSRRLSSRLGREGSRTGSGASCTAAWPLPPPPNTNFTRCQNPMRVASSISGTAAGAAGGASVGGATGAGVAGMIGTTAGASA
jgi:hypothetical protein